jgi:hypothetical protein
LHSSLAPTRPSFSPFQLWLAPPGVAAPHGSHVAAVLPVEPPEWTHHLTPGDTVRVTDLRGKVRKWTILPGGHEGDKEDRGGRLAECWKTTYVEAGTALTHVKEGAQEVSCAGLWSMGQLWLRNGPAWPFRVVLESKPYLRPSPRLS